VTDHPHDKCDTRNVVRKLRKPRFGIPSWFDLQGCHDVQNRSERQHQDPGHGKVADHWPERINQRFGPNVSRIPHGYVNRGNHAQTGKIAKFTRTKAAGIFSRKGLSLTGCLDPTLLFLEYFTQLGTLTPPDSSRRAGFCLTRCFEFQTKLQVD
jgi:hypothetical protein